MTNANPRVEIYYRVKGKRRWLRTGRVYSLKKIEQAQEMIVKLFNKNHGRKQYLLKPYLSR